MTSDRLPVLVSHVPHFLGAFLQVDVNVLGGFTADSNFERLTVHSQAEQRAVLETDFHTIGIDVRMCCRNQQYAPEPLCLSCCVSFAE